MTTTEPGTIPVASTWVPEACTLPTVEQPLRLAEFDDFFTSAVTGVRRVDSAQVELVLRPEPEVAARAADLAARETGCCSFFTFTLIIGDGSLVLVVGARAEDADVIDALVVRANVAAGGVA